ncbi:MAG: hypothetical protein HY532_08545 [Chloroflexi bacterium]|nr:hypothetical protein [Chloroflexota bacterium]
MWRQLRKLGAVYLEGGVWLSPETEAHRSALLHLADEVNRNGGTADCFIAASLDGTQEEKLFGLFGEARNKEYRNLMGECQKFLAHLDREISGEHFIFNEVEELESDLDRIQRWFNQVRQRDVFLPSLQGEVEEQIKSCKELFGTFVQEVYERGEAGRGSP